MTSKPLESKGNFCSPILSFLRIRSCQLLMVICTKFFRGYKKSSPVNPLLVMVVRRVTRKGKSWHSVPGNSDVTVYNDNVRLVVGRIYWQTPLKIKYINYTLIYQNSASVLDLFSGIHFCIYFETNYTQSWLSMNNCTAVFNIGGLVQDYSISSAWTT